MTTVALIGAPGSGKSTVGPLVAERLGVGFVDVDTWLEQREGRRVAEIFATDGEAAFRALERDATLALLREPGVVSLGGGAPLTEAVARALASAVVVWLQVDARHALPRIGVDDTSVIRAPVGLRGRLIKLLAERTPVYRRLATHTVDTSGREPDALADEIVGLLGWAQ
ncbi:MAG: shikimate kinase [Propionibacteriaceae bacterium]|nr:shikimate kinase [Propionibacteriaceae bacterium]